jgi:hypothetical protein
VDEATSGLPAHPSLPASVPVGDRLFPALPQNGDTQRPQIAPFGSCGDGSISQNAGHVLWAARLGGIVRARPKVGPRPDLPKPDAAPSTPNTWVQSLPNEPDEEPELPLLQAIIIVLLLCLGLAVVFVWAMYWF